MSIKIYTLEDIALPAMTAKEVLEMAYNSNWETRSIAEQAREDTVITFHLSFPITVSSAAAKQVLEGIKQCQQ